RMLEVESKAEYADVMERALYNTALAGMALDGRHFFYVNPLEVVPEKSEKDPGKSHVKTVRPEWLGCACCPPNLARLIASLDKYIYTVKPDSILVNLFIRSDIDIEREGASIKIRQECDYPRSGKITFHADYEGQGSIDLKVRIPSWAERYKGAVNGKETGIAQKDGYWTVTLTPGEHRIDLELQIEPKRWYCNPKVSENIRRVAIARGPQIFCAEEADNGKDLHCLYLKRDAGLACDWHDELLEGVEVIEAQGLREAITEDGCGLYSADYKPDRTATTIRLIPYYAWANRGKGEMRVWLNEGE
ncbi:MAG: glycoside hydrolase family 127 protein, partial [Lachnospiraceae bacterium]|nr:glycoside hydrolase family 127 protein [Lachnospiraceae bacterium]